MGYLAHKKRSTERTQEVDLDAAEGELVKGEDERVYYVEHDEVGFVVEGGGSACTTFMREAQRVVAGEGGACSLPEVGGGVRSPWGSGPGRGRGPAGGWRGQACTRP